MIILYAHENSYFSEHCLIIIFDIIIMILIRDMEDENGD